MSNDVYDREDLKQKEKRAPVMDDEGAEPLSPGEQASLDQMEAGFGEEGEEPDFYKRGNGSDDDDDSEDDEDDDKDKIPFNKEPERRSIRSRVFNRKSAGLGVTGLVIAGGGFGIMSLASGPAQLIHISKLLEKFHFSDMSLFQDSRAGKLIKHARTTNNPNRRNLGFAGNLFANHYQKKLGELGFELDFNGADGSPNRYIQGFSIDPNTDHGKSVLGELQANGVDIPVPDANTGRVHIDMSSSDAGVARRTIRSMTGSLKLNRVSNAMSRRLLIGRAGVVFHPMTALKRKSNETFDVFKAGVKEKYDERRRNGADQTTPALSPETTEDGEGNQVEDPESRAAVDSGNETSAAARADLEEGKASVKSKLGKGLSIGTAGIGVLCAVRAIGNQAEAIQYTNIVLPLIRTGMDFVTVGSQVMTGQDVSLDEVNVLTDSLYDGLSGTSWASAASIQAENGEDPVGPKIPEVADPGNVGEKPAFFAAIDRIPGLGAACSTAGQLFMSLAGGLVGFATDQLTSFFTSLTGIDPLGTLTDWIARKLAGQEVNLSAQGAELGNYMNYGARLAANDSAISLGGRELSGQEVALMDAESKNIEKGELQQKSLATRLFDPYEPNSLVASTVLQNDGFLSIASATHSLTSLPGRILSLAANAFGSILPTAFAADVERSEGYDYGFPEFGFSKSEMDDPRVNDPYANAEIVEARLGELNSRYGDCFSTIISESGTIVSGEAKRYDQIGDQCRDGSEDLLRYRFYIVDVITAKSMACYEGLDNAACDEIGMRGSAPANGNTTGGPSNIPGLNGYTIPCAGQPTPVVRKTPSAPSADWSAIKDSGTIGTTSGGQPIKVYVRDACDKTNMKTVVIVSSIHGTENGGQLVSHELLFNATIPPNVRIIAIPELNGSGISALTRKNANGVDLNRNNDYEWSTLNGSNETTPTATNYKGTAPASEPEIASITQFLTGLGRTDLFMIYHDNLNYVAPVGDTPMSYASTYAGVSGMNIGNELGDWVTQRGSLDAWYNKQTSSPTLLIELGNDQSTAAIQRQVEAVQAVMTGGL